MSELNVVTANIKNGSDEIQTGTQGMLEAQNVVQDISGTVSAGIREIVAGSEEIRKTMQALSEENQRLEQAITVLNNELKRFTTE